MNFLTNIYYLLGILFIFDGIVKVYSAKEQTKKNEQGHSLFKEYKNTDKTMYPNELNEFIKGRTRDVWFLLWLFIGLFSVQWVLFLFYLSFNFFIIWPLLKLTKFSVVYTALYWFNSLVGVFMGVFLVINKYHLKIDLTTLVTEFIKV